MLYFLKKAGKIAAALGSVPKPPLASGAGGNAPRPSNCYSQSTNVFVFEQCSNFSASLKLRPIILYLSDG